MVASAYAMISGLYKNKGFVETIKRRLQEYRSTASIIRVERPTRLDRARALGYKAKQGIIVVRVRVRKGGLNKIRPISGRRPKRMGVQGYSPAKSKRLIAEERAARKYPNMEVIGSYYIAEDGLYKYYEVILADPNHPSVKNSKEFKWLQYPANRRRVFRGITSPGKKMRGLYKSRGLKGTLKHKNKRKIREREEKKRHEGSRYYRLQGTKAPGK
ncbi:50S ribosomal protein L15e [Sulfolobales archaeon HS-7]|nr:50S ribosomal protein L15e [Sulfolobales archaeon HS-7]